VEYKIFDFTETDSINSRAIDDIAEEIRDDYVNYLIKIGAGKEKNINWWVLNFVSRSTLISPLFSNICYLVLLKRNLDSGHVYDGIATDSYAIKNILRKFRTRYGYSFKVIYKGKSLCMQTLSRLYTYFKVATHYFLRWIFANRTRIYQKKVDLNEPITLLDVFILGNSFKDGLFIDRYYPGLLEHVNSSQKKHIYYIPTFYGIKNYKKIFLEARKSEENFLFKEDYLGIKDYFSALLYPLQTIKFKIDDSEFKGFDLAPLIKEEISNDRVSNSSIYGLLNYIFVRKLKKSNVKIETVVNWFENQSIDHGFNLGFNKYYPAVRLIGYQGFPLANNYLSLFPTNQERENEVIPKEIYVMGKGYTDLVKKFCPDLIVKIAPAFRFSGIWKERLISNFNQGKFTILVALPILYNEAENVIETVLEASKLYKINDCNFFIKPHPTQNIKSLANKWNKRLPPGFEFVDGDFNSIIEKSNVLISCTSNTCLETIARGIPVIVIGSKIGLTQLVIPRDIKQDIWKLCYTAEEVSEAIMFYQGIKGEMIDRYKKFGEEIREKYFEPVTESGVRRLLNL
jgi:hypothetical protein